jgi:CRISPR-associated endonuclease/helicase Cas3
MLGVAACFIAIASCTRKRQALHRTAGRYLGERDIARLAVFVFLHDLRKANSGFQVKRWRLDAVPGGWPAPTGHSEEALLAFQLGAIYWQGYRWTR